MSAQPAGANPVRVLVVDDSAFMRFTITKYLSSVPGILVVGSAHDGLEALDLIPRLAPDVVTLDVEMPNLDGLSTLREIMTRFPLPVVMLSCLTSQGTVETVHALTMGAVDFIAKPSNKANMSAILEEVAAKVMHASQTRVLALSRPAATEFHPAAPMGSKSTRSLRSQDKVVIIGSSTGGPKALNTVVPMLPADLPAAVVIVQHMPVGFTHSLAERLNSISHIAVKEAAPGDQLEAGRALLAPGGFHMVFDQYEKVGLNQNPPVHGVRPAVDVTMISLVQQFGGRVVAAILTGMGNDGTNGCTLAHSLKGWVISEAEETCVVWGMPRSVVEAGAADEIVPLQGIAAAIQRAVRG